MVLLKVNATFHQAVYKFLDKSPLSPLKRRGVVLELAKRCEIATEGSKKASHSQPHALTEDVEVKAKEFYFQRDLVYTVLGLNDEMTLWANGKKKKLRKHYLEITVDEVYALISMTCKIHNYIDSERFKKIR